MEKEIIKRSLTAVKSAFDAFKKNYREGTPCGKLFDNFTVTLKSLLGDYQIKYDFLCGKDTVNIDGVTDRNYLPKKAEAYQKRVAEQVESMTMFDVSRVDLDVRKLIHPEKTSEKAEQRQN